MDQDIFTLVSHLSEKTQIFEGLCKHQTEIVIKGDSDQLHRVKVLIHDLKKNHLKCKIETSEKIKNDEIYLGHFFLNDSKYYFKTTAKFDGNMLIIPAETELYHLQRRQAFRVRIPELYHTSFNILELDGKAVNISAILRDFSSQGTRLLLPQPIALNNLGKKIYGQLSIRGKPNIELRGMIRHVQERPPLVGVEFTPLSSQLESKLFSITLEIHKQLLK